MYRTEVIYLFYVGLGLRWEVVCICFLFMFYIVLRTLGRVSLKR